MANGIGHHRSMDFPAEVLTGDAGNTKFEEHGQWVKLLLRYLLPQRYWLAVLAPCLFASIALRLLAPQLLRRFIDSLAVPAGAHHVLLLSGAYCGAVIAESLLSIAVVHVTQRVAWVSTNRLREDLVQHCLSLDLRFHYRHTPGEMIERLDGDVAALGAFLSILIVQIVGNALLLGGILLLLSSESWKVGAAFAAFSVFTLYVSVCLKDRGHRAHRGFREAAGELFGYLEERLAAAEDLRPLGAVRAALHGFSERAFSVFRALLSAQIQANARWNCSWILFYAGSAAALGVGAYLYLAKQISLGSVYVIFAYVAMLRVPIEAFVLEIENFVKATASIERLTDLSNYESSVKDGAGVSLPSGPLAVQFENVVFCYDEATALRNISFQLNPGEKLGLVGRTGSGKSTLARLLYRFYDAVSGRILLGGVPVRDAMLSEIRRRVCFVSQSPQLFQASVRANVTLLDDNISDVQVRAVLAQVGLYTWLRQQPAGLDTVLGRNYDGLSGGETQLLVLARTLLADAGLVILDEPSSMLAHDDERAFYLALDCLAKHTAIVIAHRLDTLDRMDKILVLDDGQVVEFGERTVLAANPDSHFSRLLGQHRSERVA